MGTPYQRFTDAFLSKVTEYDFLKLGQSESYHVIDNYMKIIFAKFNRTCAYDLISGDDAVRELDVEIPEEDLYEILDIVSTGMLIQWMQPYVYNAENLLNVLNTTDVTVYSPAELLLRIRNLYESLEKRFTQMVREYSYDHGDLTTLSL